MFYWDRISLSLQSECSKLVWNAPFEPAELIEHFVASSIPVILNFYLGVNCLFFGRRLYCQRKDSQGQGHEVNVDQSGQSNLTELLYR